MALQAVTTYSQFDPYSFQDRIAPYLLVDKAAGEVMDTVDELGSKAEALKKYADENPNSDYAKQYNQYMKDLDQIASDMAKYGMSATLRNNSRGLKKKYNSAVAPMEDADKLFREQQKERLAHPERMYVNDLTFADAYNNTIDNTYVDEKTIISEMALGAKAAGQKALQAEINASGNSELGIQKAAQAMENYRRNYLHSLQYDNFNDYNKQRLHRATNLGMNSALSEVINGEYMDAKARKSIELQEEGLALQKQRMANEEKKYKMALASQGKKIEGDRIVIDKDSDYWKDQGISFDSNGRKVMTISGLGKATVINEKLWQIHPEGAADNDFTQDYWLNPTTAKAYEKNSSGILSSNKTTEKNVYANTRPIIAANNFGGKWKAGFEGEDEGGPIDWFDYDSDVLDWGNDFRLIPSNDNNYSSSKIKKVTEISKVDKEALEKIKKLLPEEIKSYIKNNNELLLDYYEVYYSDSKAGNEEGKGYMIVPKDHQYVEQINKDLFTLKSQVESLKPKE